MVPHVEAEDYVERGLEIDVCSKGTEGSKSGFLQRRIWVRTVEEIEEFVRSNKPAMLYFSRCPVDPTKINQEQHARLSHEWNGVQPTGRKS